MEHHPAAIAAIEIMQSLAQGSPVCNAQVLVSPVIHPCWGQLRRLTAKEVLL
jgi:hypothetical protein